MSFFDCNLITIITFNNNISQNIFFNRNLITIIIFNNRIA